ncbi:hypothetical protein PQX77_017880 [Marasmius sp. AFHP31]|nr:hypothetical protein PQX77_017880 [Marasmius sp. AFHP31]
MSIRDSGIVSIEEPVPIVFPTPEILLENPPTPPKDTPVKSPPKRLAEKSSIARVRDRAKTLSQAPPSTLVKLLISEETTTKKTNHLLSQAVEQLNTASQRASDAEASRRSLQVQTLLERTKRDQEIAFAQEETIRAKNELDFYKRKLQETQDEALRAQQGMQAVQRRQAEAERNAAQARAIARKYRGQNLKMMAKEQGKLEGFREGLRLGREVIGARYALEYDVDGGDTGSAFIEEYFESTEGSPATAHGTPRTQPRRRDDRRSSKKPSKKHEDRTRSLGGSERHRPRQQDRGSNGSSTPRAEPTLIPPTPPSPARTPIPVPRKPSTPTSDTPQPAPLPLTPPSIRAQEVTLSPPDTPVAPPPPSQYTHSPQSGSGTGTPRMPFSDSNTYPTSPAPSGRSQDTHPRYESSPGEPEVIAIRGPAYPQSVHSEQRSSSHFPASPLHVSQRSNPVIYVFGGQTPSQNSVASPLVDDVSLHNQGYVPMPPPPPSISSPGSQRSPEIQAPLPSSGLQDREADRRREAEVSTPSTMTGIVGLRTFPSYVPTASSSGGGPDVGGRAPSVAGSASGSVSGAQPPGNHAGSVRSNGSGEQWPGSRGRRILSTIDEHSREGSPPRLTPMHTGTSVQSSQSQARVKEWRRSLSASESSPPETKPSSPMHTGSTFYAPPPSVVSQSTLASGTFPVETDLRRRRSSSSKTASIHIEVEPPSRATSDGRRTPVPGSPRGFGFSASPDPTPREGRFPSDPRPRPGYLSPNRSPMDLAPIQETGPGPNEPPVIPGQIPRPPIPSNRPSGPPATSVPMNGFRPGPQAPPHINANGQFPSNFGQQASTPRSVPLARPVSPADSDEDSEEDESTTSSRRGLMQSLYGGGKASDIPPGTVSGGTPQVSTWKSPSAGGSYESWPPNPPPVGPSTMSPASASPNPLPRPPQQVPGPASPNSWGAPTPSNSPYVQRGPAGASDSARSARTAPAPNSILKKSTDVAWGAQPKKVSTSATGGTPRLGGPSFTPRTAGTPRLGAMSPSIFASLERTLPPEASPRSKRSSLHAGTTPLFTASPIPGAAGSNSGRSSRNGSDDDDDDDRFDPQTHENTLANSGGPPRTVRMGTKVQVGVAGGSPYRPPATMSLYK